jgi:hypothetical protein
MPQRCSGSMRRTIAARAPTSLAKLLRLPVSQAVRGAHACPLMTTLISMHDGFVLFISLRAGGVVHTGTATRTQQQGQLRRLCMRTCVHAVRRLCTSTDSQIRVLFGQMFSPRRAAAKKGHGD